MKGNYLKQKKNYVLTKRRRVQHEVEMVIWATEKLKSRQSQTLNLTLQNNQFSKKNPLASFSNKKTSKLKTHAESRTKTKAWVDIHELRDHNTDNTFAITPGTTGIILSNHHQLQTEVRSMVKQSKFKRNTLTNILKTKERQVCSSSPLKDSPTGFAVNPPIFTPGASCIKT